jgi:hypothetical protein
MSGIEADVGEAVRLIKTFPRHWEGRETILKMKEADYGWKQVEWWAFYFELLFQQANAERGYFTIPGEKFGSTTFDVKGACDWDLKGKATKTDSESAILNDTSAVDATIEKHGRYGVMIALCDVEYNDDDRAFQRWREELQGGKSKYQLEREKRTAHSRYRKTQADLKEVLFLCFDKDTIQECGTMRQGRNSNAKPRPLKYMVDLEECEAVCGRVILE